MSGVPLGAPTAPAARPDPLAGTPLSRDTPVDTAEIPTPLAGARGYEAAEPEAPRAEGPYGAGSGDEARDEEGTGPRTEGFAFRTAWDDEAPPVRGKAARASVADEMVSDDPEEPVKDEHAGRPW